MAGSLPSLARTLLCGRRSKEPQLVISKQEAATSSDLSRPAYMVACLSVRSYGSLISMLLEKSISHGS